MIVVGISAFYHDAACCLLRDGRLVAAAQEERFSRVKHDARLPVSAFRYCLKEAGAGIDEVDLLAYYENPELKLQRQLRAGLPEGSSPDLARLDADIHTKIEEGLGYSGPVFSFLHHQSHAASAFYYSGFPEAAVLTVDGVGEWDTTTYGRGAGAKLEAFDRVEFPHSLGLLYSTLTAYLGFEVNDGEYKVMGLAPYGEPRYADRVRRLVSSLDGGGFELDLRYFDFLRGRRMYSEALCDLFGAPPRARGGEITRFHRDVARSLQAVLEEILLEKTRWLHGRTGSDNLCMAGGVALNCVANGRILRDGPFQRLFVQPAAGDSGGCLGAAALLHAQETGQAPPVGPLRDARLGPSWSADGIARLLASTGLPYQDFRGREASLLEAVVDRLAAGKVVGWFHGRMEMGPRALGARSLLADPRDPEMRDRLNRMVKKREAFRPFAPSVLLAHAAGPFGLDHPAPFMLETCQVRSPLDLPAITHVDGSARPQTVDPEVMPRYAALLEAFRRRTGCPMLVNTSFNVKGEPIVGSPVDALLCFGGTEIDSLVLEDFVLDRDDLPESWPELLEAWRQRPRSGFGAARDRGDLYTFV
ncbi:MAG: carbamoyltransferase N-terminal domain-containing protein [Acidobacteriota bacterium]